MAIQSSKKHSSSKLVFIFGICASLFSSLHADFGDILGSTAVGAGIGGLAGGRRGAAIGAGVGAGLGIMSSSSRRRRNNIDEQASNNELSDKIDLLYQQLDDAYGQYIRAVKFDNNAVVPRLLKKINRIISNLEAYDVYIDIDTEYPELQGKL